MIIRNVKINPGGQFYSAKEPPARKLLVLGDSIACGYGNIYTDGDTSKGTTAYEDGCQTFATMLAEQYNAQLEVVAISGIGIASIRCFRCFCRRITRARSRMTGRMCRMSL